MLPPSKYLIYFTVGGKPNYIELLELCIDTIVSSAPPNLKKMVDIVVFTDAAYKQHVDALQLKFLNMEKNNSEGGVGYITDIYVTEDNATTVQTSMRKIEIYDYLYAKRKQDIARHIASKRKIPFREQLAATENTEEELRKEREEAAVKEVADMCIEDGEPIAYKKVFYLDCDIVVCSNILDIFETTSIPQEPSKLAVVPERYIPLERAHTLVDYYRLKHLPYSKAQVDTFIKEKIYGFNCGHFVFVPTAEMKTHFDNVRELVRETVAENKYYFYEQCFMNYYFNPRRLIDYSLEKYVSVKPTTTKDYGNPCAINHFINCNNSGETKLGQMKSFMNAVEAARKHLWKKTGMSVGIGGSTASRNEFKSIKPISWIVPITVCVNYTDYLYHHLKSNAFMFKEYHVITKAGDMETRNLCSKYSNVVCHIFKEENHKQTQFNKSGMIYQCQKEVHAKYPGAWILVIDSDIILPTDLPLKLEEAVNRGNRGDNTNEENTETEEKQETGLLNKECLYFLGRIDYHTAEDYKNRKNGVVYKGTDAAGYFQLYYDKTKYYSENSQSARACDIKFSRQFRSQNLLFEDTAYRVIHMGKDNVNHFGRKSAAWKL